LEPLLTIGDLGRLLRISRPTVYRLIQAGHLHPIQVGSRKRFRPDQVRHYLEQLPNEPEARDLAVQAASREGE
jgi:excisionase family DNA binding protein